MTTVPIKMETNHMHVLCVHRLYHQVNLQSFIHSHIYDRPCSTQSSQGSSRFSSGGVSSEGVQRDLLPIIEGTWRSIVTPYLFAASDYD